jgi:hypothetical protein
MRDNVLDLLNRSRLPGRLTSEQAAPLLGFLVHEVAILVSAKLLRPLGSPPRHAVKYFSASEIQACASDPVWLNRGTRAVYNYWAKQNQKRRAQHKQVQALIVA